MRKKSKKYCNCYIDIRIFIACLFSEISAYNNQKIHDEMFEVAGKIQITKIGLFLKKFAEVKPLTIVAYYTVFNGYFVLKRNLMILCQPLAFIAVSYEHRGRMG